MMDYGEQYEMGMLYQDFITDQLMRRGISLNAYSSKKYQLECGESASGIEVKFDSRMAETGNVYIEVAEKSRPDMPDFTPSGICRKDNTWLYLIGDYDEALLMGKAQLRMTVGMDPAFLYENGIVRREGETSIGYTIPVSFCDKNLALKHFRFR